MMKLIDILRLYAIDNDSEDMRLLLKEMFTAATLDNRLDYDVLADEIIRDSGASDVRYPNTTVFAELGTRYLQSRATEIRKKLDLIYSVYDPLENYSKTRTEVIDRDTSGQSSDTRTDNLSETEAVSENVQHSNARMDSTTKQSSSTTTPNTTETSTHSVSADDESTLQLRTQDGLSRSGTETESESASESLSSSVTGADQTQSTTTTANTGTQTKANTHSGTLDEEREITEHGRTEAGQDLLLRQLELLKQLNVYSWIADSFGRAMCLNVW